MYHLKCCIYSALICLAFLQCKDEGISRKLPPLGTTKIVYNVYTGDSLNQDNYDLFIRDWDGANPKNITNHSDVAWTYLSRDTTLYFISDRDSGQRYFKLYKSNGNGDYISKISDLRLRDSWMGVNDQGTILAVMPHKSVDSVIYLLNNKGELILKFPWQGLYARDPAISPDGTQIAFVGITEKDRKTPGASEELYISDLYGRGLKKLTTYPASDTTAGNYHYKTGPPRWHPKKDFISYHSKQNGKYSLYGVTTDGSKQWKLTDIDMSEGWHSWSPDGEYLAIELFDDKQTQFHIGLYEYESETLINIITDTLYKYQQAPVFVRVLD